MRILICLLVGALGVIFLYDYVLLALAWMLLVVYFGSGWCADELNKRNRLPRSWRDLWR